MRSVWSWLVPARGSLSSLQKIIYTTTGYRIKDGDPTDRKADIHFTASPISIRGAHYGLRLKAIRKWRPQKPRFARILRQREGIVLATLFWRLH
jgi:hypothetical protein